MFYKSKSDFIKSIADYRIMSYAWGGVESGENMEEYKSIVDNCVNAGYDTLMTSYGLTMKIDYSVNEDQLSNINISMDYAEKRGLKLIPRFYTSIVQELLDGDQWSSGEPCVKYPDPFSDKDIKITKFYYEKILPLFEHRRSIIAVCPTFAFLGQSLFDGGNFDNPPAMRCCGYSKVALRKFNRNFGFFDDLPIPVADGNPQSEKTVLWFKFRQKIMTEYSEAILNSCKSVTKKPVGIFSESYPATFAHLSEASISGVSNFLLQDCTFGCETYDMYNTLAETHGDAQNYDSFEDYRHAIMPRLINAAKKGNKLMGFWWRTRPDYAFKLLPTLVEIENKYRSYDFSCEKNIAVVFTSNYSSVACPTERGTPFAIDNSYLLAANYPIKHIEQKLSGMANWHMIAEVEFCIKDLSIYDLVIISDYSFFELKDWLIIEKYTAMGIKFLITGDFARCSLSIDASDLSGWESSSYRKWEIEYRNGFKGTVKLKDSAYENLKLVDGLLIGEITDNHYHKFSIGLNYKGDFINPHTNKVEMNGSTEILTLSDKQLFIILQKNIYCVPNSLFRFAACFGREFEVLGDAILDYLIFLDK